MEKPKFHPKEEVSEEEANKSEKEKLEERVKKIHELVERINESGEIISFPGISTEVYKKLKEDDEFIPPGYVTPIDEIIARCKSEGIKIVLGDNPESGNIFVLPVGSNDIEMDSIPVGKLDVNSVENEHLKELILLKS